MSGYGWLRVVTDGLGWLRVVSVGYKWFWLVTAGVYWVVMGSYEWLWGAYRVVTFSNE